MAQQSIPNATDTLNADLFCRHHFGQDTLTPPVTLALEGLRHVLTDAQPRGSGDFGWRLRCAIGFLWNNLRMQDEDENRDNVDGPTGADRLRLIASLHDAGRHVVAWRKRKGFTGTSDIPDAQAARQGWPDATGKGWTPPWDILGIEQPDWWG